MRALLLLLGFLTARSALSEMLLISALEADGIQGVRYGVAAFGRSSDLLVEDSLERWLAKRLPLPGLRGVEPRKPFKVVQVADASAPLSVDNPAYIAILPLADRGAASGALQEGYARSERLTEELQLYLEPKSTNLVEQVAVGIEQRQIWLSSTPAALRWAWERRAALSALQALGVSGTFRLRVQPQYFADLYSGRLRQFESLFKVEPFLRDFDSLSFGIACDGGRLLLSLHGMPQAHSPLARLVQGWRVPQAHLWRLIPGQALAVLLGNFSEPQLWQPYCELPGRSFLPLAPGSLQAGERLFYLAACRGGKGAALVQLAGAERGSRAALAHLAATGRGHWSGLELFEHTGLEHTGAEGEAVRIERYRLRATGEREPQPADKVAAEALLPSVLALISKIAYLETAWSADFLVSALGSEGALAEFLPTLQPSPGMTLEQQIRQQNPLLATSLLLGGRLTPSQLLRQTVAIMPNSRPEHLRLLPEGGGGATFGVASQDGQLSASLCIQANEIAALQRINRDGRALLQELFFQMFARQMLERESTGAEK